MMVLYNQYGPHLTFTSQEFAFGICQQYDSVVAYLEECLILEVNYFG